MKSVLTFLAAVLGLFSSALSAEPAYITFPSDIDWVTRQTAHFQILYRRGEDKLAERTLRAAEKAYRLLTPIFPEAPKSTWIVLADFQDSLNGYSLDFPYAHMVIFASPPEPSGQLAALDNWLDSVVLHEFVHTLHLYPAGSFWKPMRWLFGSWVLPNGLMPSHLHEGIATFLETELTEGGRGKGASFRMLRRMAVEERKWAGEFAPLDLFEGATTRWPHGTSPYFFGYYLYRELWARKGARGIKDLTVAYSEGLPYLVNRPLEEVYGIDYPSLWPQIFQKNAEEARKEIEEAKAKPLSSLRYLTDSRFLKWDLTLSPNGDRIVYRRASPETGVRIEMRALPSGKLLEEITTEGGRRDGMCWGSASGREFLVYLEGTNEFGYALNRIYAYDVAKKRRFELKQERGTPFDHLHALSCTRDLSRLLVYREKAGHGVLHELAWNPTHPKLDDRLGRLREWTLPTATWASSLLAGSPHRVLLREGTGTKFMTWGAEKTPFTSFELLGNHYGLRHALSDGEIPFVGEIDGREEVWSFDPKSKRVKKRIALLGGANSFDVHGNQWLVSSYRHGGFDIASAAPVASGSFAVPTVSGRRNPSADPLVMSKVEDYSPFSTLLPTGWIPSMLFVPDGIQFGAWIPGFDIAQRHYYDVIGGYDTRGLGFVDVGYAYRFSKDWRANAGTYFLPSYLGSGNFLKNWGSSLGVSTGLGIWPATIKLSALFRRVESSSIGPAVQSVGVGIDLTHSFGFRKTPLAVTPSMGTRIALSHDQYFKAMGGKEDFFASSASVEQYLGAPWAEGHGFYLATRLGYTEGSARYNSFYQGGGELLFSQGRGFFLNRGFQPLTFFGTRMFSLNVEYRFPLALVDRGYRLWPAFLKRLHGAIVADALSFDNGVMNHRRKNLFRVFYASAGIELKSEWTMGFYLPTQIRLGAYHGFGPFGESIYATLGVEAGL